MIILVTGASSGIGFSAARDLASKGHKVYGAARRVDRMEPLREFGVVPVSLDVTSDESMQACVSSILADEGRIDVLVNNAGFGYFGAIENVPMEEARLMRFAYSGRYLAGPDTVSRAICRAVNARRPRHRYHPGSGSYFLLWLHALLPTRLWDALMRLAVKP
jgi:NAD(P)-dependent dehydrogenase (short-subunit alcohol dehydrogenase family)